MTVKEVLELSEVSRATLHRDTKAGKITAYKVGRNVRYSKSDALLYAEIKKESTRVQTWKAKRKATATQGNM